MANDSPAVILYDAYGNPIGTTIDPYDGYYRLHVNASLSNDQDVATETTLQDAYNKLISINSKDFATETTLSNINNKTPSLGQAIMANSVPVAIASNQSVIPINDNGDSLTIDTLQLPSSLVGGRLDTNTGAWLGSTAPTVGQKTAANSIPIVIASNQTAIPITDNGSSLTVDTPQLPSLLVSGRLDINVGAWLGSTTPTVGQKTMASSVPIVVASDQTNVPTKEVRSTTSSITSVAASTSNTQILAANPNRLGATIYNDSNKDLYLKLGTSASTTSFTVLLERDTYYEVPFNYVGDIYGVWANGASGNARVTELS